MKIKYSIEIIHPYHFHHLLIKTYHQSLSLYHSDLCTSLFFYAPPIEFREISSMLGGSGGGVEAEGGGDNLASHETGGNCTMVGVFGEEEINNGRINGEDGDRSSAGSRWPRQETLALLKIRSDMDVAFRDSNLKGPLWDDVSRKMAELGYQRSAKKCKEKFENVYKYHKRTKEGRSSKSDGKTYRFFDQLEALDQLQPFQIPPPPSLAPKAQPQPFHPPGPPPGALQTPTTISFAQQPCNTTNININPIITPINPSTTIDHHHHPKFMSAANFMVSTSSSTSSDDFQAQRRGGKKRKWKDFFEKLMRDVVEKQEELQTKFLRTIEMRERERSMREESWRMQEIARLNREHEILVQERSASAAKDAAVIAFLQKISGQQPQTPQNQPPPLPQPQPKQANVIALDRNGAGGHKKMMMVSRDNNTSTPPSSSRWPKAEVEALIKLRTSFETKYQENGPKGPFWEEISAGMRSLGYTRSSKRCKEKWENINKYFKKVKESNKQRPEDSKTCPYYHLLDAIYKEKKGGSNGGGGGEYNNHLQFPSANSLMEPLMVQPEQQWPLAPPQTLAAHQNLNEEEEEQDDMLDEDELDQDMEDEEEDEDEEAENNNNNNNNNGGTFEVFNNNNNPQHGSASSAPTGSIGTTAVA